MNIFLDANICLDLLDTKRPTSEQSVAWYMSNKDNQAYHFYFSADFISTFYYILTQKRKINSSITLKTIEALCEEIEPFYLQHSDFTNAKKQFFDNYFEDFEDMLILNSALRLKATKFITNDKQLLKLGEYKNIKLLQPL